MQKPKKLFSELAREYLQPLLSAIVLAILIRGFFFEPFKIPSESMVPTLLVGDHIFVKRYAYGLRIPFTKTWLTEFENPKRGDVVVFSYPGDESVDFIKRVIGLPGDKIKLEEGILFVNGQKVEQTDLAMTGPEPKNHCHMKLEDASQNLLPSGFKPFPYYRDIKEFQVKFETFDNGVQHLAQRSTHMPVETDLEITVPPRSFFVMGDNRDQSQDSRFWGFVPRENLKGKAEFIWLSLNNEGMSCPGDLGFLPIRWDRFGRKIL